MTRLRASRIAAMTLALFAFAAAGSAQARQSTVKSERGALAYSGIASVYSYSAQKTASGERFHSGALTAAHRSLPFGTLVRVTNRHNGRSVVVRINDRGPFVRGRVIDVTPAGARSLGFSGLASVVLVVVGRDG